MAAGRASALFAVLAGVSLALATGGTRAPAGRGLVAARLGTAARAVVVGRRTDQPPPPPAGAVVVALDDPGRSLSRHHVSVVIGADGGVWVTDLGSGNGTTLVSTTGEVTELEAHTPVRVRVGSLLSIGDHAATVEWSTTPQRIADARLTPALPVMGVDPTAPVMLAQVQPQALPQATASANAGRREKSRDRRERRASPGRVEMAAAVPVPVPVPATVAPTAAAGVPATGNAAGTRVASTAGPPRLPRGWVSWPVARTGSRRAAAAWRPGRPGCTRAPVD